MKYVFIAVNYNGSLHTENYLQSLWEVVLPDGDILETIIVDNNSSDEDLANIRISAAKRPFVRLIELSENLGYFRGLNAGLDACAKNEDTLFIVGNNDLKFATDFVVKLKEIKCEKSVLVIAPNIITLDGRRQNPHVVKAVPKLELIKTRIYFSNYYVGQASRYINAFLRKLIRRFMPSPGRRNPTPEPGRMNIKRGIGACYILTPTFFNHHARLDDRVFLWGEEALLSNQVEVAGGITLYDPSIKITHCESASVRFIEKRARYEIVRASYKIYRQYL
jgi:GT2 family glycosyltransferase